MLVEGFGDAAGPRLELVRAALAGQAGKRPLFHHDAAIAAVAADAPVPGWQGTLLDPNDPRSICAWIASVAGLPSRRSHGCP